MAKRLLLQKTIYLILYVSLHEKVIIDGNFSVNGFNSTIDKERISKLIRQVNIKYPAEAQ